MPLIEKDNLSSSLLYLVFSCVIFKKGDASKYIYICLCVCVCMVTVVHKAVQFQAEPFTFYHMTVYGKDSLKYKVYICICMYAYMLMSPCMYAYAHEHNNTCIQYMCICTCIRKE